MPLDICPCVGRLRGASLSTIKKRYMSGETCSDIGTSLGCSRESVRLFLVQNNIKLRFGGKRLPEYDPVLKLLKEKVPVNTIAARLGVRTDYIKRVGWCNHIPRVYDPTHDPRLDDKEWIRQHYVVRKLSSESIAKEIGCAIGTVTRFVRLHGFYVRNNGDYNRPNYKFHPKLSDKRYLRKAFSAGKTLQQVACEIGCCQNAVFKAKARIGLVKRRKRS